jgi:hypothetical protein
MLKSLQLKNIGPAPEMNLELGSRLNLLTGDNGLGKSFILDIAWWALTRRWPAEVNPKLTAGLMARPSKSGKAEITFSFDTKYQELTYTSEFDRKLQAWTGKVGRPANPGLVLYAQVDGSFAIWDPARNYWLKKNNADIQDRQPAYVFSPQEIWNGLYDESHKIPLCNGLINDWANWQNKNGPAFLHLLQVLQTLSPSEQEVLRPGELTRVSLNDARDIPTLKMPYGQEVPVIHASAGMRRILSLAYLLVWAWEEHRQAAALLDQPPTSQIIFLIDEIEAHLHPKWQRQIVRALLTVIKNFNAEAQVQLVAATHSPLVMASVEPIFEVAQDAWFDLNLVEQNGNVQVELSKETFIRRGDATEWLLSEAFDLNSSYSLEAENILAQAAEAMNNPHFEPAQAQILHQLLCQVLSETDPFWLRWRYIGEKRGWLKSIPAPAPPKKGRGKKKHD